MTAVQVTSMSGRIAPRFCVTHSIRVLHRKVITKILVDSDPGILVLHCFLGGHSEVHPKYGDSAGEKLQMGKGADCLSWLSCLFNRTKHILTSKATLVCIGCNRTTPHI